MRPSFHPRLINGPFDDPGLFISYLFEKRALIFDLGDIQALSARDILKISHVFITHTHMDHFVGFDRLLRILLGREKTLFLYGPQGVIGNVEGKLAGYAWNLVNNFSNRFALNLTEVRTERLLNRQYVCQNGFLPGQKGPTRPFNRLLLKEPALSVSTEILDHKIPCLGFAIKERFHVNIRKEGLAELGLGIGPWLKDFKAALYNDQDPDSDFEVKWGQDDGHKKTFTLGFLSKRIARITKGQKIAYVADAGYSSANVAKIMKLAKGSDHLFIEAAFLEKNRETAAQKYHLTARQAGTIAGKAGVKQFTLFHFSPRYNHAAELLQKEAREAYHRTRATS
jgi:ribonuclease Z